MAALPAKTGSAADQISALPEKIRRLLAKMLSVNPSARPRVPDLAAFQDWFHTMGWVKEKVPIERVVDLTFLQ